ncbi:hypothetical protein GN956_G683 [Arapaima gigas]
MHSASQSDGTHALTYISELSLPELLGSRPLHWHVNSVFTERRATDTVCQVSAQMTQKKKQQQPWTIHGKCREEPQLEDDYESIIQVSLVSFVHSPHVR